MNDRQITNIIFYNDEGILFETHRGWFGYGNNVFKSFDLVDEVKVRRITALNKLDKKENFVQGIEKLINATSQIPRYTAYFIADNIPEHEARTIISAFNDLYNKISPFAESQITISENQTEGVSESLTENFSQSISKTLSETITNTFGTSESTTRTAGKSHTKNKNSSHGYSTPSLLGMFLGAYSYNKSKGTADTTQNSTAIQKGSNESHARASQTGEAR